MIFSKVILQIVVVEIVLRFPTLVTTVAEVTALMLLPTVRVQLVVSIESLSAETTLRMPLEPTLINGSRIVVSKFLVLSKLGKCEELMFMREHFLVSCAKIAD